MDQSTFTDQEAAKLQKEIRAVMNGEKITEERIQEIQDGLMDIEEIMDGLDEITDLLEKSTGNPYLSIRQHVEYMIHKKKVSFTDKRFHTLFVDRNSHMSLKHGLNGDGEYEAKEKQPDTKYRERLAGYVVPNKKFNWDEERRSKFLDEISRKDIPKE